MAIDNHESLEIMRDLLDIKLLSQYFDLTLDASMKLENRKLIAQMYANLENGITVLSDLKARRSYIYYVALAGHLGLDKTNAEIRSIWEDDLLSLVNPVDLQKKYRLEFQFFRLFNLIDIAERTDYGLITKLRVRNKEGKYILIKHRLVYISSSEDKSVWLALCL